MDILDKTEEIEEESAVEETSCEEIEENLPEKPAEIDHDKLLEDEIKQVLNQKSHKVPHHKCSRCHNDLGSVDQWFNYGIKAVKFGYTMIPQPLCKNCFKEFEEFMHAFDKN